MTTTHKVDALFHAVQLSNILGDGKTFPDCIPNHSVEEILRHYEQEKDNDGFDLKAFVLSHYTLPFESASGYQSDSKKSVTDHIESLWDILTRQPDEIGGSLIPLPHAYVVPGGRFREIYYWDSYFTMLGLRSSGRWDLISSMIKNFAHLIDTVGYIPNGNRTYFIGRSQPPFFSLMVRLLYEKDKDALIKYLPQLEKEYQFWMKGSSALEKPYHSSHRVVKLPDGILNRYWDEFDTPRPESYKEDVELAVHATVPAPSLFRNLRAACESGWDFSSRWFRDVDSFGSIHTVEILPVDLNCLLYHLELTLADTCLMAGNSLKTSMYKAAATERKKLIRAYCWNESVRFYCDYDYIAQRNKVQLTLAAVFPLFFQLATPDQALAVEKILKEKFLQAGGLITTLYQTGQQWDAPNGWAPLQWMSFLGLKNYGLNETAEEIRKRWTAINEKVFAKTGKMTEKYDVMSTSGSASGGEYPNQDGFGWTNGVYLAMKTFNG